jgi:arylsulfatase A-like enzyme
LFVSRKVIVAAILLLAIASIVALAWYLTRPAQREEADERVHPIRRMGSLVSRGRADRPDVVVVLLDTVRADYLGAYGYERPTSPFLTELAENSAVFERAFSTSSWTAPSTASVFTGRYPWGHGIVTGFLWHQEMTETLAEGEGHVAINRLRADQVTLPEQFQRLGYVTVGLASNLNIGDEMGFDRGFDRFVREDEGRAEDLVGQVAAWQEEIQAARPFFLYLHLNDAHYPYKRWDSYYLGDLSGASNQGVKARANYESEIGYLDAQIRDVYERFARNRDTVFVVVTDHGEEFGDHGGTGHGSGLFVELNRVALIVHAPRLGVHPKRYSDVNVSLIDVMPTLLDLVGGVSSREIQGRSLVPLLRDEPGAETLRASLRDRPLFAHRRKDSEWWAVQQGPWKLILQTGASSQLYDHRTDPNEHKDLYAIESVKATELLSLLEPLLDEATWIQGDEGWLEVNKALEEKLKSLGYVN